MSAIRLLLLEDAAEDAELILRELRRASLDVSAHQVASEVEFRATLLQRDLDVILADYHLPGFSGEDALRIARELRPDVPFIFVSGSIGEERAIAALRSGATDYIFKDRLARLGAAVERAMEQRRERERLAAAEDALRLTSQRFEYAARATADGLWDWDLATNKVWSGDTLNQFIGEGDVNEHDAAWWEARVHPEDFPTVEKSMRSAIESGSPQWRAEYRMLRGDGSYSYVSGRAWVVRDGPIPIRVIGAAEDITSRRQSEEALRESERRFRSVAESAPDAIVLADAKQTIIFANQETSRMFGVPIHELIGSPMTRLVPDCARDAIEQRLLRLRQAKPFGTIEVTGVCRGGREFPLEVSISTWMSGGELFFTTFMRDVSERVAARRRQQTQFEVTRLLARFAPVAETMPQLMRIVADGLGAARGEVWLFDSATGERVRAAVWQRERECNIAQTTSLSLNGSPLSGTIELFEAEEALLDSATLDVAKDIAGQVSQYLERIRIDRERAAGEMRLREAHRLAHLGNWEFDARTGNARWSDEVYCIFGVERWLPPSFDYFIGAIAEADRERVLAEIEKQRRNPGLGAVMIEHRINRPDGTQRVVETRGEIDVDDAGELVRAFGTVQDITEQAEAAQTIDALRRRNESILECAAEGIAGCDLEGRMTFMNPAALAMFRFKPEEFANVPAHNVVHHTRPDGSPYPLEECPMYLTRQDGKKRQVRDEYFWRANGERFPVEYECAPIFADGKIEGAVLTFRDVTERQALERRLAQIGRVESLGRVAATIAHEINNVLMGIEPFAEIIRRRAQGEEQFARPAEQISNAVRRGRRVTEAILRFTKPAEPVLVVTDFGLWLQSLEPELRGLAGATIDIELKLPDQPLYIACDSAQMQQVVTNLVVNARDAMPAGGCISIDLAAYGNASAAEPSLLLTVRDEGMGIPAHVVEEIFEPLFTTKRSGTGLGLAVARQVVTMHGGSICAMNRRVRGAAFTIQLPLAAPPNVKPEEPVARIAMIGSVLLVEDEELVALGLSTLLESEGIDVSVAGRGDVVAGMIEERMPDAVILDLTLPDTDGATLFRALRERWPLLPVVFSTGHGGETELSGALQQERVAFLRKPYELRELLTALQRVAS